MATRRVEKELQILIDDVNNWLQDLLKGTTKISPSQKTADIQRWFVAIHPFGDGNGRMSRFIQDMILEALNLPLPASADLQNDIFTEKSEYRSAFANSLKASINYLESCLEQHEKKTVSKPCEILKKVNDETH